MYIRRVLKDYRSKLVYIEREMIESLIIIEPPGVKGDCNDLKGWYCNSIPPPTYKFGTLNRKQ